MLSALLLDEILLAWCNGRNCWHIEAWKDYWVEHVTVKSFFKFLFRFDICITRGFPSGAVVKNPPANAGRLRRLGSIRALGRSSGVGHGNPLQYSCLENSMDRGSGWATDHWVTEWDTAGQPCGYMRTHVLPGKKPCGVWFSKAWFWQSHFCEVLKVFLFKSNTKFDVKTFMWSSL